MRKIFPLISCLLLGACTAPAEPTYSEASEMYEYVKSDKTVSVYFEKPISAEIVESVNKADVNYGECNVVMTYEVGEWLGADEMVQDDVTFQSLFSEDGQWLKYRALAGPVAVELIENVQECMSFVNALAKSVSDEPMHVNEQYGFAVKLFEDWGIEIEADRILMSKTVTPEKPANFDKLKEKEQRPYLPFDVELSIVAQENPYEDLGDLVIDRFQGYSVEFLTWGSVYGVQIGDQDEKQSLDRFFFMSEDGDTLYEASLSVWSIHYNEFAETLKGVVSTVEIF